MPFGAHPSHCGVLRRFDAASAIAVVVVSEAHLAVAFKDGDAATAPRLSHPHGVPHRAPLAGEVRDRDAARPALVDVPDAVLAERYGKDGRRTVRQGAYFLASTV